MCGIVGVVGLKNTTDVLMQGLEKLEYRGYDSAGIFVSDGTSEYLVKAQGRIKDLSAKITPEIQGTIGIGHTRWATHGIPSEKNAHPHTSENQRFVLVHNGVIENYEELQEKYLDQHHFIGETDTEIIVHLIEEFAKASSSTKEAFKKALAVISGSYAFALLDKENPDVLYIAKNKSPLLIGLGDTFNVVCSDAMAMLSQTREFVDIHDQELVTLSTNQVSIETLAGVAIQRKSFEAEIDLSDIDKGAYPYYMLKEIDEQPTVMRQLTQHYTNTHGEVVIDQDLLKALRTADRLHIIACGTSYHAGLVGKKLLEDLAEKPTEVHLASEFGYNPPLLSKKPFFIFISQSGETADSRQVLVKMTQAGYPTLTLTNVAGSTLSREADFTMLLHAGPEIAVASTKAYTAQIATLALLAKALGESQTLPQATSFQVLHELSLVANGMESIFAEKDLIQELVVELLTGTRNAFYIGRSTDYFVSLEAALKLKEISYIQAEGFAAGELKHGTIALIEEGTPVIAIITDPVTAPHTRGNLQEVQSRGAKTMTIAMESVSKASDQLVLPTVHPLLTPLISVVACQLLAYYATLERGYDVDKPRNLAKSVTVE